MAGKSQMGIFHAEQMPLNLPPSEIAETLIKYVNELRPHVLVLDTRGQRSHAETVLNNISCPVVGISTTGQELHATRSGNNVAWSRFSPSMKPLIQPSSAGKLYLTLYPVFTQPRPVPVLTNPGDIQWEGYQER